MKKGAEIFIIKQDDLKFKHFNFKVFLMDGTN